MARLYHGDGPHRGSALPSAVPNNDSNPPATTSAATAEDVFLRVGRVLQQIRPAIQADGGDVELVEVTEGGVVRVRFHGACIGCPSAAMTLQTGIEHSLRERVPEVTGVEALEN